MAKSRKTFDVNNLRIVVNNMLEHSTCSRDIRWGMMTVLEHVLHETGNYRGFRYLEAHEVPAGELPGIVHGTSSKPGHPNVITDNKFPDESRVYYI